MVEVHRRESVIAARFPSFVRVLLLKKRTDSLWVFSSRSLSVGWRRYPPCALFLTENFRLNPTAKDTFKRLSLPHLVVHNIKLKGSTDAEALRQKLGSTRFYAVDLMFGRFRVLVSVSAAFPISPTDGEVVYNFRGTLDTANFLGQLFRTFSDVLNLGNRQEEQTAASTSRRSGKP